MRLYPPVITAIAAGAMLALDQWAPLARMAPRNPWGAVPAALGLGLMFWAAWTLWRRGTTLHPHEVASTLVVTGPFRLSRNPIYLGFGLILGGLAVSLASSAPFAALAAWVFAMGQMFIRHEEASLAELFGAEFDTYAQKVGRWF